MVAKPPVVARKGQGRVLFRWQCWSCSACLRLFVVVVWLVFVGGLGGIATIGAALRRVAGVSGVYGRKTPRVVARLRPRVLAWVCCGGWWYVSGVVVAWVVFDMSSSVCRGGVARLRWWLGGNCYHRRCVAACRRRVRGLWSQNPRVLAQSAVHLGGMRVTWGVWGVVDFGLGALVRGEVFSAGRRVGYVGPQCVLPG